uniref:EGF domain-specific O-linked N-acetylglucosamine transferase n=1 Tax=Plectus sambesii TaxID=2011161 RepID=A0A914W441_9BILA
MCKRCSLHGHLSRLCFLALIAAVLGGHWTDDLLLPPDLLPYAIRANPELKQRCLEDKKCPVKKDFLNSAKCWGYETDCDFADSYSADKLQCPGSSNWPNARTKQDQMTLFNRQTDFLHVQERLFDMKPICSSTSEDGSSLVCSDHLRYCRAKNIYFDFKSLNAATSTRYRDNVIQPGQVGGRCDQFDSKLLKERSDHMSYLQSWAHELQYFESHKSFRVSNQNCDVIFERPTVIIKLDAAVNMYHHFCDFINLYASQHINGSFSTDIDIVWWDTFSGGFVDSMFGATWKAFTNRRPVELISLDGKKVCFKDAMLPLLARQRLGLYYNMPVVDGCHGSGLFHAFCHHLLHRLGVKQRGPLKGKVRITLLSRGTQYRRILNENKVSACLPLALFSVFANELHVYSLSS